VAESSRPLTTENVVKKKEAPSPILKNMLQSPPQQATVTEEKIFTPCVVAAKSLSLRRKPSATISKRPPTPVKEEKDNSLRELSFQNTNSDSSQDYSPPNDENWPPIISTESDEESKGSFLHAEDSILTTLR
jgi:hypothetical protein